MVAIVADYRVFGRHKTSPFEAMADAKSAIRWVRSHAKELGVNPDQIAAGGGSSGGHIALSAAVLDAFDEVGEEDRSVSSKPNALVLFNPAVDTTHGTPAVLQERFGGRANEASPLQHVRRGLPPTVIFHGKADTTVPYADVERFCAESTALGNQCQLFGYEGATHGFFNQSRDGGKWYRETLRELDRFLTKIGYLSVPAQQQVVDPDFKAVVDKPAYQHNGPIVAIDEAHSNFHTASGQYKPFADLLRSDGYQVVASTRKFDRGNLSGFAVLVVPNANAGNLTDPAFTEAECDVVRNWVREGGALLLIADHAPFGTSAANFLRGSVSPWGKAGCSNRRKQASQRSSSSLATTASWVRIPC